MNYNKILIIITLLFLLGCEQINQKTINFKPEKKYKNTGFTLVYNNGLDKIKKLDQNSLNIYHNQLKSKSTVKITNPKNGKSVIAQVKRSNAKFSNFYNSIISSRIAETLELDLNMPYIEIILVTKNSTFIAKKAKTFEEEKKVAKKAPIDGITINDLNTKKIKKEKVIKKDVFSYSIKVADFYYEDTAKMMVQRIKEEALLNNSKILHLSKTKFRVIIGPFNDIQALQESFEKMISLNFENLEIIKDV